MAGPPDGVLEREHEGIRCIERKWLFYDAEAEVRDEVLACKRDNVGLRLGFSCWPTNVAPMEVQKV